MSEPKSQALVRKVFFALWSMVTLVLFFCVVLLVNELLKSGSNPLALPEPQAQAPTQSGSGAPVRAANLGQQEALLYFSDPNGSLLLPEPVQIERSESTVENCRQLLDALIKGPRDVLTPILPNTTKIRALYLLEGGELVIDFSRELEVDSRKSASAESLMIYGVVNTLSQPVSKGTAESAVTRVRFLIEGASPQDRFPAHIDLSNPVTPDTAWVASGRSRSIGNA